MKFIGLIQFIGVTGTLTVFYVFGLRTYIGRITSATPTFTAKPKYKRLVWRIHRVQSSLNPYYTHLSIDGKRKFISRLIHLLAQKKFVAREGAVVTLEKRIVICGALVQLTFGLSKYLLPKFKHIVLYPQQFRSKILEQQVKGLTWGGGTILLSWLDTYQGYHEPHDNVNLAIHEWAHAFRLDHSQDRAWLMYWKINRNNKEIEKLWELGKNRPSAQLLRPYGYTNEEEYFAAATEHFFESPKEMYVKCRILFDTLVELYNQNPLKVRGDYRA